MPRALRSAYDVRAPGADHMGASGFGVDRNVTGVSATLRKHMGRSSPLSGRASSDIVALAPATDEEVDRLDDGGSKRRTRPLPRRSKRCWSSWSPTERETSRCGHSTRPAVTHGLRPRGIDGCLPGRGFSARHHPRLERRRARPRHHRMGDPVCETTFGHLMLL